MTPSARVAAAIEILDAILAGAPAEKALTGWARRSRFAGSGDRAAIRDHVFQALRCKRSFAAFGGAMTGRGLMLGALRAGGQDPTDLFTGERFAPPPVAPDEAGRAPESDAERYDIPDWLWPDWEASLGDQAVASAKALQNRAPVHLRVNLRKATVEEAHIALEREGIETEAHPAADTALTVLSGARRIAQSAAYREGLVELQDAASQAVVAALDLSPGMRVLDYCAGGGGKALALAASTGVQVFAHDAAPERMRDLPGRAERAGVEVALLDAAGIAAQAPFDLVLVDAPCSGSGSWRRAPAGKWALTSERLRELPEIQTGILAEATRTVTPEGVLVYATCSVLDAENRKVTERFLAGHPDWQCAFDRAWPLTGGTDGFYCAHLTR